MTEKTISAAISYAKENNIKQIVIASNTGTTALLAVGCGLDVTCVTHAYGYIGNGKHEMNAEARAKLVDNGIKVLTTTHVLSGAERGISSKFGGSYPVEIIAHSLRMFGQGTKVCVEVATMALDAGMVEYGTPIIAVGGTGRGADTAVVITPAHAGKIFECKIHHIISKPF